VVVLVLAIHQNCDNFFPFSFSPTKWPNFLFCPGGKRNKEREREDKNRKI
jgi:hypothetical protein